MNATPRLLSSTSIEGIDVKNPAGENIGKIKDLMIDWTSGKVAYAVLSFGGFLGMGDKLFAVPLESFEFDTADENDRIVLNVDKEHLEDAPGFDKDHWPNAADHEFTRNVYSHYDVEYKF